MNLPGDFEVVFSEERIRARTRELGAGITRDLLADDPAAELVAVGILKGSLLFMADLVREIRVPLYCDFLRVASYEGMESTGVVRLEFDLTQPIAGKHVLIVEDIIDTGLTMRFLLENLRLKKPRSLKVCSLLDKPANRKAPVEVDYVGFTIPNRFVIGYGLDLEGLYRNLPYIAAKRV